MNENVLIVFMYAWAVFNFSACLYALRQNRLLSPKQQNKLKTALTTSLWLNICATVFVCGGMLMHFYLWLIMAANLFFGALTFRLIRHRYEKQLQTRNFAFKIERVKHNRASGVIVIDGICYRAFLPPVWIGEYRDEDGRLYPGTYKKYRPQTVQQVRFKRFVPAGRENSRPVVELV